MFSLYRKGLLEKIDRSSPDMSELEQDQVKAIFKTFDIDSHGFIQLDELKIL